MSLLNFRLNLTCCRDFLIFTAWEDHGFPQTGMRTALVQLGEATSVGNAPLGTGEHAPNVVGLLNFGRQTCNRLCIAVIPRMKSGVEQNDTGKDDLVEKTSGVWSVSARIWSPLPALFCNSVLTVNLGPLQLLIFGLQG